MQMFNLLLNQGARRKNVCGKTDTFEKFLRQRKWEESTGMPICLRVCGGRGNSLQMEALSWWGFHCGRPEDEIIDQPGSGCGIDSKPKSARETEGKEKVQKDGIEGEVVKKENERTALGWDTDIRSQLHFFALCQNVALCFALCSSLQTVRNVPLTRSPLVKSCSNKPNLQIKSFCPRVGIISLLSRCLSSFKKPHRSFALNTIVQIKQSDHLCPVKTTYIPKIVILIFFRQKQ